MIIKKNHYYILWVQSLNHVNELNINAEEGIETVKNAKSLGILFDKHLAFVDQINAVIKARGGKIVFSVFTYMWQSCWRRTSRKTNQNPNVHSWDITRQSLIVIISKTGTLNSSNFFKLSVLSRENHLLSDLDIWHSGSLDLYLQKWCSVFWIMRLTLIYVVCHYSRAKRASAEGIARTWKTLLYVYEAKICLSI